MRSRLFDPVFVIVSAIVVASGVLLALRQPLLYRPYFGGIPPFAAIGVVCLSGWSALYLLDREGTFRIHRAGARGRHVLAGASIAVPFMLLITSADLILSFPRDINVPLPGALLFYPLMGYVVELFLHAVPLAILMPLAGVILKSWSATKRVWLCIALSAIPEAAFQAAAMSVSNVLTIFVTVHLFLFGLTELYVFRRFGFVSMFGFRMSYYAYWHIVWGHLRLESL
jgi:hypothetical protein